MLEWLRATDRHPSAAQIHAQLRGEFPRLSLGTVYRNLEVLVSEGAVEEVPVAGGPSRYDGNPEPHHHFTCEQCGRIVDVTLPVPRGLARRLEGALGLRARRIAIDFYGSCDECEAHSSRAPGPTSA